ncbi:MAG: glutathione synthase [Myxococcales bacterium]|nr:glutathione synthase [Myxococcales bacterium]
MIQRIAVVMDPLLRVDVFKDTTFVMILEALARGYEVHVCTQDKLGVRDGQAYGAFQRVLRLTRDPQSPGELGPSTVHGLGEFEIIWMRKDPPVDMAYSYTTQLLDLAPPTSWVLNAPTALRSYNEKLFCFEFPSLTPRTLLSNDARELKAFYRELGEDMVLKPLDGAGGKSIFRVIGGDKNLNGLLEMMTDDGRKYAIAQQFIPDVRQGDKRIIVIDGEPVGATLRVPPADDNRANIHVGGRCVKTELTAREREICAALAPTLRRAELMLVGLDVIGDYLTEINITSPTGVQEINQLDGVCLESILWDRVEAGYRERAQSSRLATTP